MPTNRIIPSLLLRNGRLVKGRRFDEHKDAGAPATTARAHSAQGADEILLLDIDASREKRLPDFAALAAVACEVEIPLTFGGGIQSIAIATRAIEAGADKVCLTTTALDTPDIISEIAHRFGTQAVMVGLDVMDSNGQPRLFDHRTHKTVPSINPIEWAKEMVARGAGEIRLCVVAREGMREGLDIPLFERLRKAVGVPIIVEGGAGNLEQVADAMRAGVDSIALGTLLVFSDTNLVKLRRFLEGAGLQVRP
jgi:cyclase